MRYQELAPSPQLAPWVHCVWIFESDAGPAGADRIVPDGRPELVIHFGRPFAEVDGDGASTPQPRAIFLARIAAHRHEDDAIVTRSVETLESCDGGISMDELVAASGPRCSRPSSAFAACST